MKYIANPVEVEAFRIKQFTPNVDGGDGAVFLENGATYFVSPEMISRMTPVKGDYYVIQSDGYIYLNPKAVFERKYKEKQ